MGSGDHVCEWREQAESLAVQLDVAHKTISAQAETIQRQAEVAMQGEQLSQIQATVQKLQRHVFGKRSEKIPRVADAIRDPERAEAERIAPLQTRRENAEKKRQLVTRASSTGSPTTRRSAPTAAATSSRSSATAK